MHHVTPIELERAKAQGRADMLMGQESVMRRADMLGHQILAFNRAIPISETVKKLMAVSRSDVQHMAQKLFSRKPILTAFGPLEKLESYSKIVERLKG